MANNPRRAKFSKQRLQQALILLLHEHGLSELSVTQLCHAAGVNRSTFYAHYQNTRELLSEIEEQMLREINVDIFGSTVCHSFNGLQEAIKKTLFYLQQHRETYMTLCYNSPSFISLAMEQSKLMGQVCGITPFARDCNNAFVCSGLFAAILFWLENQPRPEVEQMTSILVDMLRSHVRWSNCQMSC